MAKRLREGFTIEEAFKALNTKPAIRESHEDTDADDAFFYEVYDKLFYGGLFDSEKNAAVKTPYKENECELGFLDDGSTTLSITKDSKDELTPAEKVAKKFGLSYSYKTDRKGKVRITIIVPEKKPTSHRKISEGKFKYFNIDVNGDVLCDDDGNELRFRTYKDASEYIEDNELENATPFGQAEDRFYEAEESMSRSCPECGKSPCVCKCDNTVNEDVASSMPVQFLPIDQVRDFITNLPAPNPSTPPRFFKLGYMKELRSEIPSKFKGGRGSEDNPIVRIFKAIEYSALYTGADWKGTNATKAADKILGVERHTGEKTGFSFQGENNLANRIGTYADGSEALQAYIADHSKQKVKFFISLDDSDLHEATREEVAEYLTPAQANRLLNPSPRAAAGTDAEGNDVYDKPIQRFKLTNIYMIGNLGHSII